MRRGGDFGGFLPGAMVAPEVVIVDGLEVRVHRNHAGAGGIERDGLDGVAVDAGLGERGAHGRGQRAHVVRVALRGVVGIFLLAQQRILAHPAPSRPLALSKMETRTLRVPKSTPATMLMIVPEKDGPAPACRPLSDCRLRSSRGTAWRLRAPLPTPGTGWRPRGARSRSRRCSAAALQVGDSHHAGAAEGVERIVGEFALAHVAVDAPSRSLVEKRAKLIGLAFTRPTQVP